MLSDEEQSPISKRLQEWAGLGRSRLLGQAGLSVDLNFLQRVYLTSGPEQGLLPLAREHVRHVSCTVSLRLPSLVAAGLSHGCLAAVVSAHCRGAGSLRRSSRCNIQLAVEYIVKGKYLRLRDVCLLEPTHTRQDSLFSADSRNRPQLLLSPPGEFPVAIKRALLKSQLQPRALGGLTSDQGSLDWLGELIAKHSPRTVPLKASQNSPRQVLSSRFQVMQSHVPASAPQDFDLLA